MMTMGTFLRSTSVLLGVMALLAVLETFFPFSRKDWRKRHLVPNVILTTLTLGLNFVVNAGAVLVTAWLNVRHFGPIANAALPPLGKVVLGVVVLDASTYVAHRLMHVIPPLWRAHSVHHSDPLVDVTTALRFHPIESAWRLAFVVVPAWVLGLPVAAVATYRIMSAIQALFEHVNVRLWQPLDTALSIVVTTPNMHKLHHSRIETETNTNYGNILSLFDRVCRTFTPSARRPADSGLKGYDDVETAHPRSPAAPVSQRDRERDGAGSRRARSAAHIRNRYAFWSCPLTSANVPSAMSRQRLYVPVPLAAPGPFGDVKAVQTAVSKSRA